MQQRIAAAGPERMAAYWTRLGELRAAYLPCIHDVHELMVKKKPIGVNLSTEAEYEHHFSWITTAAAVLRQTEGSPCGVATFTLEELDILQEKAKVLFEIGKAQEVDWDEMVGLAAQAGG
jgi:hypothetical protein